MVQINLHSVFTGGPGTGKTTLARLYASILKKLGVIKLGHLVEVDRSNLIGGYLGQTATKTKEVIDKAMDGVLFIDEAYSIKSSEDDWYGDEAINTLIKNMEDYRSRLVVIVAGYTEKMQKFLDINPGLKSRFSNYISFPNYCAKELLQIFSQICKQKDYKIHAKLNNVLLEHFESKLSLKETNFGNARYARNLFEKIVEAHSNRIVELNSHSDNDLSEIGRAHV